MYRDVPRHYGIKCWASLTIDHLLSIILYTDTNELSSDFSASFRKRNPCETLSQIKGRNSQYWWWSRRLREAVELYGEISGNSQYYNTLPTYETVHFYTGTSKTMQIPSFCVRLCAPTSTSIHLEVAASFAGRDGMILQFGTNRIIHTIYNNLRLLDVSWISKYREEDERYLKYNCFSI